MNYNYPARQLRYDMTYLSGQKKINTILNFTSLWLNDTLFMYTWATAISSTPQCVALDMGFGMMRPDWFVDANQSGLVWNAKKSDSFDAGYHRTVMSVKDAGQGGPADDEVFTCALGWTREESKGARALRELTRHPLAPIPARRLLRVRKQHGPGPLEWRALPDARAVAGRHGGE